MTSTIADDELDRQLDAHGPELRAYCYRMLASPFDAEDAVQETLIRAWRSVDTYRGSHGAASLRSWLYRIATNVCLDMLRSSRRRATPMDLGPAGAPVIENLRERPEATWLEPIPDVLISGEGDPADVAVARDSVRLAFVAALQHLPPRQRAVLILCEVLQWRAAEVADLLDTSIPAVTSALQRARATLGALGADGSEDVEPLDAADRELLDRYVRAFEEYDIDALTALIHEDATQSMPPFDLWLSGRDNVFAWWFGPGITCRGSRVIPTRSANGAPAFGQYKPVGDGRYEPWALQVVEVRGDRIGEITFFLGTETLFPLFGLPPYLEDGSGRSDQPPPA